MLSHDCFWMNVGRMHRTHLDWPWDHLIWSQCALHHMSMSDKSNIIDEAETLLFTIWLDELRRTYWERNWAYNDELFTAKYEMQVWMTWQFHVSRWPHILEGYVSTKVEFITDWQSWWVLARCAQSIKEQFLKNPGDERFVKLLHDKSSNTTLRGIVKLDKQRE